MPARTRNADGGARLLFASKTQCAAVRMCEASTTEPVQRNRVEPDVSCTNTVHGAACTWIVVPPMIAPAPEERPAASTNNAAPTPARRAADLMPNTRARVAVPTSPASCPSSRRRARPGGRPRASWLPFVPFAVRLVDDPAEHRNRGGAHPEHLGEELPHSFGAVQHGEVADRPERLRGLADDLRELLGDLLADHRLLVLGERLGAGLDRLGLGEPLRLDRLALGEPAGLASRTPRPRRSAVVRVAFGVGLELDALRVGGRRELDLTRLRLGLRDPRVALRPRRSCASCRPRRRPACAPRPGAAARSSRPRAGRPSSPGRRPPASRSRQRAGPPARPATAPAAPRRAPAPA